MDLGTEYLGKRSFGSGVGVTYDFTAGHGNQNGTNHYLNPASIQISTAQNKLNTVAYYFILVIAV